MPVTLLPLWTFYFPHHLCLSTLVFSFSSSSFPQNHSLIQPCLLHTTSSSLLFSSSCSTCTQALTETSSSTTRRIIENSRVVAAAMVLRLQGLVSFLKVNQSPLLAHQSGTMKFSKMKVLPLLPLLQPVRKTDQWPLSTETKNQFLVTLVANHMVVMNFPPSVLLLSLDKVALLLVSTWYFFLCYQNAPNQRWILSQTTNR